MKRFSLIALVLVAFVVGSVAGIVTTRNTPAAQAQDGGEMMTHVCDSSTILLLYIAEYEYGYHTDEMDLASFEKGQFAPLFDMMMMDMDMMDDEEMMDDEDMMAMDEAMAEAEAAIMEMMGEMDGMTMLGGVEGEDEACTALRDDVQLYLVSYLYTYMMMEEDMEDAG